MSLAAIQLLALAFVGAVPILPVQAAAPQTSPTQALAGYRSTGSAPLDMQVLVNLVVPLRNTGLLTSMAKEVSDPSSPLFRHFLTSDQIRQEFLPTSHFNSVMSSLQGTGLRVIETSLDSVIVAQGSVAQVKQYLHADVSMFTNGTRSYYLSTGASTFDGASFVASNATALLVKPKAMAPQGGQPHGNVTFTATSISAKLLPAVYNATSLYAMGFQGQGQTIGIMDFYGSPTVGQDLKQFDKTYGFPDTNFTVVPIGPYNPNLGVSQGWNFEISLDVQSSHAMAPKAAVDLFIPNNALTFAAQLGPVISADKVTDLSMSFGIAPEYYWSFLGAGFFYGNALVPDELFALGSLRGISFLVASGDDGGGGGYSTSPAGQSSNPNDSPFVTSVGGTQSYIYTNPNGTEKFVQTAWSNEGYVPVAGANAGGSGGGISFLEPKPWYQQSQATPATYPNGRMEPDLALQGACDPSTDIVVAGTVYGICGTSESSPLLGGLLTLVAGYTGSHLGLITPFLYSLGNNAAEYTKAFTPITEGYNIPWTASFGYNMVTGWGSPNIGEIASLMKSVQPTASLGVRVSYTNSSVGAPEEFTPGQKIAVSATITNGASSVSGGSFTASLVTLAGTSLTTSLAHNSTTGTWQGTLTMGQESGIGYIQVSGSSSGQTGSGIAVVFAGYLATFVRPSADIPWDTNQGIPVTVYSTDLAGNIAPTTGQTLLVQSYSILSNSFKTVDTVMLTPSSIPSLGNITTGSLTANYPAGPLTLMLQGNSFGEIPIMNGISLQGSYIFPEVAAEPGAVAPGQSLTIITFPAAPDDVFFIPSFEDAGFVGLDIASGSNVSASLVSPSGATVAKADLYYQPCRQALRLCGGGLTEFNGYLNVPTNATSGLYTIVLNAAYNSITLGYTLYGSYYGQVMVTSGPIVPKVTLSPSTLYQGQSATLQADIRYPDGQEVTQGEYTAVLYPQDLSGQYTTVMHSEYAGGLLVSLAYSPALKLWVGNVTIPSGANAGSLGGVINGLLTYGGPYEAFVTGLSWDGVPTTSALSAQQPFFVQPYVYSTGQTMSSLAESSGLAFSGDTITASGTLANDLFVGTNTISGGTVTITGSQIQGTLIVNNAQVTLVGVSGGDITASGSTLVLKDSSVGTISLTNSKVGLNSSTFKQVSPALPSLTISLSSTGPFIEGTTTVSANATGQGVSSVTLWLDGALLGPAQSAGGGLASSFSLDTSTLVDGPHTLTAVAVQSDGLSTSTSKVFSTDNHIAAADAALGRTHNQLVAQNATLADQGAKLASQGSSINNLMTLTYVLLAVSVAALVVAGVALMRRKPPAAATPSGPPPPPVEAMPTP